MMSWQCLIGLKRNVFPWLTILGILFCFLSVVSIDIANGFCPWWHFGGGQTGQPSENWPEIIPTVTMRPPPPPPSTTYTSIPLSPGDVISRSIHNLTAAISRHRPWSEFVASGVFGRPDSASSVFDRVKKNFRYFFVNYSIVVSTSAAIALLGSPVVLLILAAIVACWFLFHFFREDPLIIWGCQVSDRLVLVFLTLASIWAVLFTSCALNLAIGVGVGLLLCATHAIFRDSDGLFLDEDDAVAGGLIVSGRW